jgi:hypothetical protein
MMYVLPWRRTTLEPGLRFSDLSELRTFITRLLVGPPATISRAPLFRRGSASRVEPKVVEGFVDIDGDEG